MNIEVNWKSLFGGNSSARKWEAIKSEITRISNNVLVRV